jgi:hypothetical protein
MSLINNYRIGAVGAIYVGDAGLTDKLTPIFSPTTQGGEFRFSIPQKFQQADNKFRQDGFGILTFTLTFFACPEAERLSNGNSLTQTNAYDPSAMAQYAIVLLPADATQPDALYIPRCQTVVDYKKNKEKLDVERVPVVFTWTFRNRFATPLPYYEDTEDNLKNNSIIPPGRCPY